MKTLLPLRRASLALLASLALACGGDSDVYTAGTIRCRFETCDVGDEVCCEPYAGDASGQHPTCGAPGSCAWSEVACDGPEDCQAGQVCCVTSRVRSGGSTTPLSRCTSAAACTTLRKCHTRADCAPALDCCVTHPSTDGLCVETCR